MNVSLTNEIEQFIHSKVAGGYYQNASEVVRAAVRQMRDAELEREQQLAWIRQQIDRGWQEAEAGQAVSSAEVKSSMTDFKKRWKAKQPVGT